MTDLCTFCGHALPNAVGVGVYCNHCGEPVRKTPTDAHVEAIKGSWQHYQVTAATRVGREMTPQQVGILNSLVTFAAENVPGGLSDEEAEVARIVGALAGVPCCG
jgi:hypothetical protein